MDELSEPHDICPVCGAAVKKQNLAAHYGRVNPKRTLPSDNMPAESGLCRKRKKNNRRLLFYALLFTGLTLSVIVVAQVISGNTVRLRAQSQLSILIQGAPSNVPSDIGINQSLWLDHSLDRYGVAGHSPLTTRDTSGTIHVDSNTVRNFTLQEFFRVWGETVDLNQVAGGQVPPAILPVSS